MNIMLKSDFKAIMLQFLNIPYSWSGKSPVGGLDCSGLVEQLLKTIGVDPPSTQNAQAFYNYFYNRPHQINIHETGSLCFYGTSPVTITHIGITFDGDYIIEARGGTSQTVTPFIANKQDACVGIRPYTSRKDLVACIFPDEIKEKLI